MITEGTIPARRAAVEAPAVSAEPLADAEPVLAPDDERREGPLLDRAAAPSLLGHVEPTLSPGDDPLAVLVWPPCSSWRPRACGRPGGPRADAAAGG